VQGEGYRVLGLVKLSSARLFHCTKDFGLDHLHHAFEAISHIVVGEANDAKALALKPAGTFAIPIDRVIVRLAIDFDDQSSRQADEVDDIGTQAKLPAKPTARASLRLELLPQTPSGDRLMAAKK
jgi:hypothetical protein